MLSSSTNSGRRGFTHLDMKVAELNDGESVEAFGRFGNSMRLCRMSTFAALLMPHQ